MTHIAVYPGTFDPITKGHVDIVKRASKLFDKVIVAVALTDRKQPFLELDERMALVAEVLERYNNVRIARLRGLLVDFVKHHQAQVIVRGLRAVSDFDYEFQLAHMNHRMEPDVETVFFLGLEGNSYISGTLVREIVALGGDVSPFVPSVVASHLQQKIKKK